MESLYPMLLVADVARSAAYYRDKLGFAFLYPEFAEAHLAGDFAMLQRGGVIIQLKALPDGRPNPNVLADPLARQDAFIHAADPDALCAELAARDVRIVEPVMDTAWGTREFRFADDSGYVFACGHLRS